jgi:hypothetical protein
LAAKVPVELSVSVNPNHGAAVSRKALEWLFSAVGFIGLITLMTLGVNPLLAHSAGGRVIGREGNTIVVRYRAGGATIERPFDTEGLRRALKVDQPVTVYYREGRYRVAPYLEGQYWQTARWGFCLGGGLIAVYGVFLGLAKRGETTLPPDPGAGGT